MSMPANDTIWTVPPAEQPADWPQTDAHGFIGRRHEVSEVRRILPKTRLLTLTGAGGVGKTRLARRVSEIVLHNYRDGVRLVELATVEDEELLAPAVAAALGIRDTGQDLPALLMERLADKRMLLVLDNCEHLLDACARLVHQLLRCTSRLRILATSRQSLGVYGEQVLLVPSLPVPEPGASTRDIARRDAVRLFAERAATIRPGFHVDAANAQAVARLARRLDGIPLAIELAAVRLRTTSVEDLVNELDKRLDVPAEGCPSPLARHQTLRATMEWSYELCSSGERRLWERLSMFPGGTDLDTAEAVCPGQGLAREDVLDLMAGLVDKSILSAAEQHGGGIRYRMLETIRAYGREQLPSTDAEALRERYIDHYRRLTGRVRVDKMEPAQIDYYRTLTVELPNVRAALDLCFDRPGDAPAGLEIASALWAHWLVAGALGEGRHWVRRGLALVSGPSVTRVMGLWANGVFALYQGDPGAGACLQECLALARQQGDEAALAFATQMSGVAALSEGDAEGGLALVEDALARHRARGDVHAVGVTLYFAALYAAIMRPDRAAAFGEELVMMCEERKATLFHAYALYALGLARWEQGDWRQTEAKMRELAAYWSAVDDRWGLVQCLEVLAWTAGAAGRHERAARLLGAAQNMWRGVASSPSQLRFQARSHQECTERARRALGAQAYTAAFRDGTRLGPSRTVAYALEEA
ncbi:ATP-binding protein [Nonomuraea basaltis]|uniref:ATP-binding protein n=1 Tax=Nonomuraea basaltis TaxID=2495887 RepID=UPI00110C6B98|nr:AAA family ATPase [Nonomuraea basaltis]TMR97769.1 LuxR family transcriptional regulator [Nonomuraea basaltis]